MDTNRIRGKWAAVGAAIAVSLGAGGIGISHATTSSGEKPIYLPIEPCRLSDTRPAFQVGPRSAPLGPNETYDLSGWGAVGDCNLPANTAGLALNVTAVDPTAPTFLTLFPDGVPLPLASNLNPTPGEPPTPNAVNVDLSAAGMFSIYNLAGNVHIIIDVVGIYDDHNHDDRYYTETEIDSLTTRNPVASATSTSAFNYNTGAPGTWQSVISTSITIPEGFTATVEAVFGAESTCSGGTDSWCSIRILSNGTSLAPAEGTANAFDSTDSGTADETDYEETSVTRVGTLPAGSYTIVVEGRAPAGLSFRLDDKILFVEAHLSPA